MTLFTIMDKDGIIIIAIVVAMLAIVFAFIFHKDFRQDLKASEGEMSFGGMNIKGVAPIVLLGLCLFALLSFKSTPMEGGESKAIAGEAARDTVFVDGPCPPADTIEVITKKDLSVEELYDLAFAFKQKTKNAKCETYVFRLFEKPNSEINDLGQSQQLDLALMMSEFSKSFRDSTTAEDKGKDYIDFIGKLGNVSDKNAIKDITLREAEIYYNMGSATDKYEWRLKALTKYFERHEYSDLPSQSKTEAMGLYEFLALNTRFRQQIEQAIGAKKVVSLNNAITQ